MNFYYIHLSRFIIHRIRLFVHQRFIFTDIIPPITFYLRSVTVIHNPLSLSFIQPEVAVKRYAVFPFIYSFAVFEPSLPVSLVYIPVVKYHLTISIFFAHFKIPNIIVPSLISVASLSSPLFFLQLTLILISINKFKQTFG